MHVRSFFQTYHLLAYIFALVRCAAMKKLKRKPFSGKHNPPKEQSHWLREGRIGQETLFEELDPYFYAIEQSLASRAASIIKDRRKSDYPSALLISDSENLGLYIQYVIKHYQCFSWLNAADDFAARACEYFNVQMILGDPARSGFEGFDLILVSNMQHEDQLAFSQLICESRDYLNDGGRLYVLLCGGEINGQKYIQWTDSSCVQLEDFMHGHIFQLSAPHTAQVLTLRKIDRFDAARVHAFLKRNREYFGKNTREIMLQRLREEDFCAAFGIDANMESRWVGLFGWEQQSIS